MEALLWLTLSLGLPIGLGALMDALHPNNLKRIRQQKHENRIKYFSSFFKK